MAKKPVFTTAWNAADLYYVRLSKLLAAAGELNQVRGIYDKLDAIQDGMYVHDDVVNVFNHYFGGDVTAVHAKHDECSARFDRCKADVQRSMEILKVPCTDGELDDFIMLAYGTHAETTFRGKVQGYINTQRKHLGKQVRSKNPVPVQVLTPTDMIAKYQAGLRKR